ncbi:MAG: hypothetical protein R3359_09095 [Marinirhabdus sp.]|nr:hypothetical protein [Marinirhabdus sp.]
MNKPTNIFKSLFIGDNKLSFLDQRYLPRWVVVIIDSLLCVAALLLSFFILNGTRINFHDTLSVPLQMTAILICTIWYFLIFKSYSGIIRHSTFTDILKLALTAVATSITLLAINTIYNAIVGDKIFLTTYVLLYMFISFTFLLLFRIAVKESFTLLRNVAYSEGKKKIAILGVDDATISLARGIITESQLPYELVGFITQQKKSKSGKILGKPVIHSQNMISTLQKLEAESVLLMSDSFTGIKKRCPLRKDRKAKRTT